MADSVIQALEKCWKEKVAVDDFVHKRLSILPIYMLMFLEKELVMDYQCIKTSSYCRCFILQKKCQSR